MMDGCATPSIPSYALTSLIDPSLIMHAQDIYMQDCFVTRDISDDDSFLDMDDDASDFEDDAGEDEERIEILRYNLSGTLELKRLSGYNQDFVGPQICGFGWISGFERELYFDTLAGLRERTLDALAVLAETVGGPAREEYRIPYSERMATLGPDTYRWWSLQALLIVIRSSKSDPYWWQSQTLYIRSRDIYQDSFTSSLFEGRILFDYSPDRPWDDLVEVMRIVLPHFREMNARIEALSNLQAITTSSSSSDSASIFGRASVANLVSCLDIAESVTKMVPVFGDVLEGACGVVRKIIQAAEFARAARDECKALAEHTTCITLAIVNEIGSRSSQSAIPNANIFDLCATIGEVERRITRLSTLGRFKYFTERGKINDEVKDLRARVDNARIAFKIRSDISTAGLLYDLRMSQTRLASRVEDIYVGQQATHHMLHTLLVEVRGRSACVNGTY